MGSNNTKTCLDNYILLGDSNNHRIDANVIISEAKSYQPEMFEGNEDSFSFELRYAAPFDKNFYELKRLQGTAAEVAGRRNEFRGYIVMDMNGWLTHHDEEYFNKALLFLIDMSDYWKYVFLVDNQSAKPARELVGKILSVFLCDHIPCRVKEENIKSSCKRRVSDICKAHGVICSSSAKVFLQELLEQGFGENAVTALLSDMSWNAGEKFSMNTLVDFMTKQESVVRYMLTTKEYDRLLTIIEKRKERRYGEKEAV